MVSFSPLNMESRMRIAGGIEIDGVVRTREEWCELYRITTSAVSRRMQRKGMSLVEAITTPRKGCIKRRARVELEAKPGCPVEAREIPGYPNYLATIDGRLWSVRFKRMLRNFRPRNKDAPPYYRVTLSGDNLYVHRVVCMAWHSKPSEDFDVVDHIDRNTFNNQPDNLRWTTMKGNADNRKDTIFTEYKGEKLRLQDALMQAGLEDKSPEFRGAYYRVYKLGMDVETAIQCIPVQRGKGTPITIGDESLTQAEWCAKLGIPACSIRWREKHKNETKAQAILHLTSTKRGN